MAELDDVPLLPIVAPETVKIGVIDPVDRDAEATARQCLADLKAEGEAALRRYAEKFGDIVEGGALVLDKAAMKAAFDTLSTDDQVCLENTAKRVTAFAEAQRASITEVETPIPGGVAGQSVSPCKVAGCYAPGGRYPLPSSVIMTAATARAAGVETVVVASPRPVPVTLAAAHVAGADMLLAVGGAQAVAALALGACPGVPRADVVVGPGNKWVTAAKSLISGQCGIDMLAGPSEVLVLCDATSDPETVAADLLAQAEHDIVARPILVSTDGPASIDRCNAALQRQLATLPTAAVARESVKGGFAVACSSVAEAVDLANRVAPEHLEVMCADATSVATQLDQYGGLFVGNNAAEVLGDYGIGPNHTLPTGGTARYTGGLSVFSFLRIRTWMRVDDGLASQPAVRDAVRLARLEGLEGHARAAERRLTDAGESAAKKKRIS
jgi:histidinol dehydrogenase